MHSEPLNEHDANQGAQSKGEFLGMTGNSAWYLLGAAGTSVLIIIVLWGVLGFPLLVCLGFGAALCGLSVAYVFGLKNNKPEHYDTDFFEAALVDAGILPLAFGPRMQPPPNPFRATTAELALEARPAPPRRAPTGRSRVTVRDATPEGNRSPVVVAAKPRDAVRRQPEDVRTVPLVDYERLREELDSTEEALEDALTAREEDAS